MDALTTLEIASLEHVTGGQAATGIPQLNPGPKVGIPQLNPGGKVAPPAPSPVLKPIPKANVLDSPLARYKPGWNPMRDGFSLH